MEKSEWLAARRTCVTGTDIAAILGVHPYVSIADVWANKIGIIDEIDENPTMYWGKRLEYIVGEEWFKRREFGPGARLRTGEWIHTEMDGFRAGGTPDYSVDIDGEPVSWLECKTASAWAAGWGFGEQNFPTQYYCQCQWYMLLTGAPEWNLAVLIGGNDFRDYVVPAHKGLQKMMIERAGSFWRDYVVAKQSPPADSSESYRKAVGSLLPCSATEHATSTDDIEEAAMKLALAKKHAKENEDWINQLQNTIVEHAAKHQTDTVIGKNWKCSYKEQAGRKSFDYKKLFGDFGITQNMLKDYEKVGKPYRVLKFNYAGEE
jgi:putative phage-type endonuclease